MWNAPKNIQKHQLHFLNFKDILKNIRASGIDNIAPIFKFSHYKLKKDKVFRNQLCKATYYQSLNVVQKLKLQTE